MATRKQILAAKRNIKKAQKVWQEMTSKARARRMPEGRARLKPGLGGAGKYYHVTVRDKRQFSTFRAHDVGKKGMLIRVAGKRPSGSWATQKWLVHKSMAHVEDGYLVPDHEDAKKLFKIIGKPKHVKGDVFVARGRINVPESAKPTPAQVRAWKRNIKKAQAVRLKMGKNPRGKG